MLYEKYIRETFNELGQVENLELIVPENYNFAYDVIDALAEAKPGQEALCWINDQGYERHFTFADLRRLSDKAANLFRENGLKKGDMVMLILKRHWQFWVAILALHKLGAVTIPATHLLTKKDVAYRVNSAGIKAVVCTADGDIAKRVDEALPESPSLKLRFMAFSGDAAKSKTLPDGWIHFDSGVESASESFIKEDMKSTDPMLLYFTSGTTGYPKMVLHNYHYSIGHLTTAKHWQQVIPGRLHFTVSDTGWGKAAWGKLYGQWLMEAAVFVYDFEKFTPADILPLFQKYNIATFCAPPTMFRFFIKEDLSKYDLSSLEHASIAGEALNPEVFYQFLNATGIKLTEGFGQTETTMLVGTTVNMEPKPGSMGRPNPQYDVDIVDENGKPAAAGVTGEIVAHTKKRHPAGLFHGYYKNPELTGKVWSGGMYHTGDTAWKDEDGYYWYVGRTDDIIKSSGYRIGPFEIESVLMEHPAVLECAVTGVPDDVRGQVVKATVVVAKGFEPSEALKKELQEHVKKQTAPYKYPRIVAFTSELPKTISGKIRRVELR
ncbi:MAG: AMP-binding protein [Oscillospiraceae bacterium]|jgi:acetyl-CoA synthetase|nr:AMP-binding protein [Oscillospiraceae bacterium]